MRLYEYFLHPLNAIKQVYNYHREPVVRSATRDRIRNELQRKARHWLSEYFDWQYEGITRIEKYASYKEMDQDPLISSVLDTFTSTAAQPNGEGITEDAGRSLWAISPNSDVKRILTRFFDEIGIEENLQPIFRGLVTFGDQFEDFIGVPNKGVVQMISHEPWTVGVLRDETGRVCGYGEADAQGEVTSPDTVVPLFRMAHFKMPLRYRTDVYGVNSSILYNARDYWIEFQWCCDKVWIERQQRRPPRLAIALDVGGVSTEEAFEACKEWEEWMYRDIYTNPTDGLLRSSPMSMGEQRDIFLPAGSENRTTITNFPGSTSIGSLDDLNFFLKRLFGCLKFPSGYLNLDIGDTFNRGEPIEKQDLVFAQACMRPQRAFLTEMTRICMVHLNYLGIDPLRPENHFLLQMTPVSTFAELERKELLGLRFDLMERALQLGRDNEWNKEFWDRYVMTEYARLPEEFVNILVSKEAPEETEEFGGNEIPERYKSVLQYLEENPRARDSLLLHKSGWAQRSSHSIPYQYLPESIDQRSVKFSNKHFEAAFKSRLEKKAKARIGRMVLSG